MVLSREQKRKLQINNNKRYSEMKKNDSLGVVNPNLGEIRSKQ